MPRIARQVFAGVPHHVTQRGNRRENVFFSKTDRQEYLFWLGEYGKQYGVEVLAYCLMTNHVHLVLVPDVKDSLQLCLKPLHMRYAQRVNKQRGWKGHVWQGRYFSSPLDERYTWAAIRYVERNPVRAGMVNKAEDYLWSSAAAHCGFKADVVLTTKPSWLKQLTTIDDWSAWLSVSSGANELYNLRANVDKGLPCGSEEFVHKLEKISGVSMRYRPQGRPRRD